MAFVIEHHEEIEHDLLPEHDLLDVWRGKMSWRRLHLLIKYLPPDSTTAHKTNPTGALLASWDTADYILADLFDIAARAHFKDPAPYPRPKDIIRRLERNRWLEEQRERVAARDRALEPSVLRDEISR